MTSFPARNLTSDGINSLDHSQIERIDKGLKIVNDEIKKITKRSLKSALADTATITIPTITGGVAGGAVAASAIGAANAGGTGALIVALSGMPWIGPVIGGAAGLTAGTIALISKLRKRKLINDSKDKV
jgi:uncharacterized membrane protein